MKVLVDTCVWSYALRKQGYEGSREVSLLEKLISQKDDIYCTGIILQELLQGFTNPGQQKLIIKNFNSLPFIVPSKDDHIEAAELKNTCRKSGRTINTIDALLAQLCIKHKLLLLTNDKDFNYISESFSLKLL